MSLYTVRLNGVQKHIQSKVFEDRTHDQVLGIINWYEDPDVIDEYGFPKFDGNVYELNGDYTITITKQ